MEQDAVVVLLVGFSIGWIGIKIWRFFHARRSGKCLSGCGKCGGGSCS